MSKGMGVKLNQKTRKALLNEKALLHLAFKKCFEDGMVVRNYLKTK